MADSDQQPKEIDAPPSGVTWRRGAACALTSVLVGLSQGLGLQLVTANLAGIQGSLGATPTEASWLTTAYFATALSAPVLLTKFRLQYGLRLFASIGIVAFVVIAALHLVTNSLTSAILVRAALGLVSETRRATANRWRWPRTCSRCSTP